MDQPLPENLKRLPLIVVVNARQAYERNVSDSGWTNTLLNEIDSLAYTHDLRRFGERKCRR